MMKIMRLVLSILLAIGFTHANMAQAIYVIGNPNNCKTQLNNAIEAFFFNSKGYNASRITIIYSHDDGLKYGGSKNIFQSKTIKKNKNWKTELDDFYREVDLKFTPIYNQDRIANAMNNVSQDTRSKYKRIYYINLYNDNFSKAPTWISVNVNRVSIDLFSREEIKNKTSTLIINAVGQHVTIEKSVSEVSIMLGGILELDGTYTINIGRPTGLEFMIKGIHDEWQDYQSVNMFFHSGKKWKLILDKLTSNGQIEIRLKCLNNVISNVIVIDFKVLNEPKIELIFPSSRQQLANCNEGKKEYFMKIRSNVDPNSMLMRVTKTYSLGKIINEPNGIFNLTSNTDIEVKQGTEKDVYCLLMQCPIFFRSEANQRDEPCKVCIDPYDVWEIQFALDPTKGVRSDWSIPVEVSLVSFSTSSQIVPCPCE